MLVICRKRGERIRLILGDCVVWITVTEIDRNKCRIGISAPEEVRIHREELLTNESQKEAK